MLKVGIIVITRVGAQVCADELKRRGIDFILDGANKQEDYIVLIKQKNWARVVEMIVESIDQLLKQGADVFIMPSNTPHYAYHDVISKRPDIHFLNLIELSSAASFQAGITKVAVLGTKQTMEGNLYDASLEKYKIEKFTPDQQTQAIIEDLIFNEIIPKGEMADPKKVLAVKNSIIKMFENGLCNGVILGCTELPVVFNHNILGMPAIDTTRLLALKAALHVEKECSPH